MGRLKSLLEQLLGNLGVELPPWAIPACLLLLFVLLFPLIRRSHRSGKARKILARARYAPAAQRLQMERQVLEMVGQDPVGLMVVAEEALRRGRSALAHEATERLRATGKRPADLQKLLRQLDTGPHTTLPEEILAIQNLRREGLTERARERWERAVTRWPQATELERLLDDEAPDEEQG